MIYLWDKNVKFIYELNLNNLVREIEFEKKVHQLEEFEYNLKKNTKLIDHFLHNNTKIKPLLDIVSYYTNPSNKVDVLTFELTNYHNTLEKSIEDISQKKNSLQLITNDYERKESELKILLKEREKHKKLFEMYQTRVMISLKRKNENLINTGSSLNENEESLFISEYMALVSSDSEMKAITDQAITRIVNLTSILEEEIDPLIDMIMDKEQFIIQKTKLLVEKIDFQHDNFLKHSMMIGKEQNSFLSRKRENQYMVSSKIPINDEIEEEQNAHPGLNNFSLYDKNYNPNQKDTPHIEPPILKQLTKNQIFRFDSDSSETKQENPKQNYNASVRGRSGFDIRVNNTIPNFDSIGNQNKGMIHPKSKASSVKDQSISSDNTYDNFLNNGPGHPHPENSNKNMKPLSFNFDKIAQFDESKISNKINNLVTRKDDLQDNNKIENTIITKSTTTGTDISTSQDEKYLNKLSLNKNLKVKIPKQSKITHEEHPESKTRKESQNDINSNAKNFPLIIDKTVGETKGFLQMIKYLNDKELDNNDKERIKTYLSQLQ